MIDYTNQNKLNALGLTFDTDWAPEFILENLIDVLRTNKLKATFFSTNYSDILVQAEKDNLIEIAIHPNFFMNSTHGDSIDKVLNTVMNFYPNAVGMRSHGLYQSSPLLRQLESFGIKYDCNLMLDDHPDLIPFKTFFNVTRIPYHWSDATHLLKDKDFLVDEIQLNSKGLKILDFHPILWYLNSSSYIKYDLLKKNLTTTLDKELKSNIDKYINLSKGVKTLFELLISYIKENDIKTYFLKDLHYDFIK